MSADLFRAIPESKLAVSAEGIKRQMSARIPTNVPYVVDNLWEWLRPEHYPSRRHSTYASPTPELALLNASAALAGSDRYVACRLIVAPSAIKLAQLEVVDARHHADIRLITQWFSRHSKKLTEIPITQKRDIALLFLPGLKRDELETLRLESAVVHELCEVVQTHSTFWTDASSVPRKGEGELFFELIEEGAGYHLEPI
ncbi:hypothetical protein [Pseudomonas moorei]|uniref:hypothetical protein n=1 Tax=Pseudomonas moorei TaxID=395599 RepID=UPI001FF19D98|nr:hypothetical protein [Pseudomonas moorei]